MTDATVVTLQPKTSTSTNDVSYSLTKRTLRGRKVITLLEDISGFLQPGTLTALLGPSGCGKTTLLDVLAGRKTQGSVEGSVLYADTLIGTLTPYEMLCYTAYLKLPLSMSKNDKLERVNTLIDVLGLTGCRNTKIGTSLTRGISGGQARRVSLGISLITKPRVLFLDEASTGLDARTSDQIWTCIRNLCLNEHVAVCATIHTPTAYCFQQFDRIMLMARGRMVYSGPNSPVALGFFHDLGYKQREGDSPAEALLDIVTTVQDEHAIDKACRQFATSAVAQQDAATLAELANPNPDKGSLAQLTAGSRGSKATVTPFWFAAMVFFRYRTWRNYTYIGFLGPRVLPTLLFSVLLSVLYQGQGSQVGLMQVVNISALNFMWVVIPAFAAGAYTPTISLERRLFYRERNDGLYRTTTYLACKMVEELIIMVAFSAIVSVMVYFVVELQGSFVLFWLVFLVANAISVAFAYLVAAASPNLDVANAVVPAFMMVMLFFAGFLILVSSIPGWLRWIVHIDFLKYGFTALQENYWSNINEPIIDFDRVEQSIANRTADFVATLPDRLNIPLLRTPPSPFVASPSPANLGQRVVGVFTNTWDDITSSLRQTVVNATRDVTRSATQSVLGVSADTVVRAFNDTLVNITTGAIESVRGGALDLPLQLQNISDLSWGEAILTVTASGGPYDPWLSLLCQSAFFFFFLILAWLAMAFIQHQHR